MTFGTTRAEIAAALSTVPGVTGYVKRPNVVKAGSAWPLFQNAERGPGLSFLANWRVVVALGGDEADATEKLDELLVQIAVALDPVAFVGPAATPIQITTNAGDLYGIEILARSE